MNKERELSTGKIGTLMGHYAVPCILSLLVGALYNIVDQIFIANASYLGSYGNAAKSGGRCVKSEASGRYPAPHRPRP